MRCSGMILALAGVAAANYNVAPVSSSTTEGYAVSSTSTTPGYAVETTSSVVKSTSTTEAVKSSTSPAGYPVGSSSTEAVKSSTTPAGYPVGSSSVILSTASTTAPGYAVSTPILSTGVSTQSANHTTLYSTSTLYSTTVHTVTSCASTVTNCPAGHTGGSYVTTEIISVGTTICPVTETEKVSSTQPAQTYPAQGTSTTAPGGKGTTGFQTYPVGTAGSSSVPPKSATTWYGTGTTPSASKATATYPASTQPVTAGAGRIEVAGLAVAGVIAAAFL